MTAVIADNLIATLWEIQSQRTQLNHHQIPDLQKLE